jgi:hypothetical protein
MAARIAGVSPTGKTNIFSSQWVRNPSFVLADVDCTGFVAYHPNFYGAAITRRHTVQAAHAAPNIGDVVAFIDSNGSYVERTITNVASVTNTDICLAELDSELPSTVASYPVFASFTEEEDSGVKAWLLSGNNTLRECKIAVATYTVLYSTDSDYSEWTGTPQGGDSGHPCFVVYNGGVVLLTEQHTTLLGPNFSYYLAQIQAITSPYTVETIT